MQLVSNLYRYTEAEKAKVYDENKNLLDTVTVLTDARASDHAAHAVVVRKWWGSARTYKPFYLSSETVLPIE
jgi:hypothetical protein